MKYTVNDTVLSYNAAGDKSFGKNEVLASKAIDLTKNTLWHQTGFVIEQLFDQDRYKVFSSETNDLLKRLWRRSGLSMNDDLPLQFYHQIATTREQHLAAVELTKLIAIREFPGGIEHIESRISEICKTDLVAKNPFDGQSVFHFRVIRPNSGDNNPLHRDVWLEDYADCINLYIPVCGSNAKSSLIMIPGSHLWSEARVERTTSGAMINGVKFNVPAVTGIAGEYEAVRPDPSENEVLVFSPYLVHGGAVNLNQHLTRISIELRLWKK